MHRILASSLLLATAVSAFVPAQQHRTQRSLHTPLQAVNLAGLATIPNPFQQLPWNVVRNEKSKELKYKIERSKLHRELGIAEDATYEEIIEATEILKANAEGNKKRQIQIDVFKDKILQARLNERLAGLTSDLVTDDAKAQSGFEEDGNKDLEIMAEQAAKSQKKEWNPPAWTRGLIVKPDRAQVTGQVRLWGILTLVALAFPPFVEYSNRFTWLIFIAQLSFRGMPKDEVTGGGVAMQFGGMGGKKHLKVAWLLGMTITLLGGVLTYGLLPAWAKGQRWTPLVVLAMRNFIYGTACCYLQPYKP